MDILTFMILHGLVFGVAFATPKTWWGGLDAPFLQMCHPYGIFYDFPLENESTESQLENEL